MTDKTRIQLKCWNPDCPRPDESYSYLITPEQESGLIIVTCPYCGEEGEIDLAQHRDTIELTYRRIGGDRQVNVLNIYNGLPTRPRGSGGGPLNKFETVTLEPLPDRWMLVLDHESQPNATLEQLQPEIDLYIQTLIDLDKLIAAIRHQPHQLAIEEISSGSVRITGLKFGLIIDALSSIIPFYVEHWKISKQLDIEDRRLEQKERQLLLEKQEKNLAKAHEAVCLQAMRTPDDSEFASSLVEEYGYVSTHQITTNLLSSPLRLSKVEYNPELRQLLTDRLSIEEVKNCCFDMKLDYENLPDQKGAIVREMLLALARVDGIFGLQEWLKAHRPDIDLKFI